MILGRLDPDCGYDDWFHILAAVRHETGGSDEGFTLVNEWSARGRKYCGEHDLRTKWRSFEGYSGKPVTEGTLRSMLQKQGDDLIELVAATGPQFEPCAYQTIGRRHSQHPNLPHLTRLRS